MTIGIDVSQAVYGTGVSDYTVNLFCALKRNYPNDIFVPVGFSLRRRPDLKKIFPDAQIFPLPSVVLDALWNRLHIMNFENFSGPLDIYHSSDWTQAPSRAKKVTTVHDLSPVIFSDQHDPEIVQVHKRRLSHVAAECDAVICVSQSTADDFLKHYRYPKSQVYVIPEALPSKYLLKPGKNTEGNYILAIGARQPRKNIQRLISAYKLAKKYKLPKLIVAGENLTLRSYETNGASISFTGFVSDQKLVDLFAHAKCLVYPSIHEGFGLNILAAFHFKVPVVCSDIPVFHETAGPAAVYFDPCNEESIAQNISLAIQNKNKLVKLGAKRLTNYSWDQTAQKTMQVYQKLCS